jgi:hypothetical protein
MTCLVGETAGTKTVKLCSGGKTMSTKGYAFCFVMAIVALASWFHPIGSAQAATAPTYEYEILPVQVGVEGLARALNAAGAKGSRTSNGACARYDDINPQTFCDNLVLVRERQ